MFVLKFPQTFLNIFVPIDSTNICKLLLGMVPGSVLSKKLPDENFLNLGDDVYGVEFLNCKL